jgi:hypothetical protein
VQQPQEAEDQHRWMRRLQSSEEQQRLLHQVETERRALVEVCASFFGRICGYHSIIGTSQGFPESTAKIRKCVGDPADITVGYTQVQFTAATCRSCEAYGAIAAKRRARAEADERRINAKAVVTVECMRCP